MNTFIARVTAVVALLVSSSLAVASSQTGHVSSRQGDDVMICLQGASTAAIGDEFTVMRNRSVQRGSKYQPILRTETVGVVRVVGAGDGKCVPATLISGSAKRWDAVEGK